MTGALMFRGAKRFLLEIMFRESAKTVWAKIKTIHNICYKAKYFNIYACYDKTKAQGHLFDIALELQTNKRLIRDFGQLFYDDRFDKEKKTRKKSIAEFVTANGIKVMAISVGQSTRGLVFGQHRPDFYVLDDFENAKTYRSKVRTASVIEFIDELLGGISVDANVVFLANRIASAGSVSYLETKALQDPKRWTLLDVPVGDPATKKISWPSRFVWTDEEADRINAAIPNPKLHVVSLEAKQRLLGSTKFMQDFLNKPTSPETQIIKETWIVNSYYTVLPSFKGMTMNLMADPAAGETAEADEFALSVMGWTRGDQHRYMIESLGWRQLSITQKAGKIVAYWLKYRQYIDQVGVEVVMNQTSLYQLLREWVNGANVIPGYEDIKDRNMPLIKIDPKGKTKLERVSIHEAKFERGEIHLQPHMVILKDQLISMPNALNDDRMDTCTYNLEYSHIEPDIPGSDDQKPKEPEPKPISAGIRGKKF